MKKIHSVVLFMTMATLSSTAGTISKDAAQQLAAEFLASRQPKVELAPGVQTESSQLTLDGEVSGAYLFNNGTDGGFVIVSDNDAAAKPILGYSDKGSIDADNLPPSVRYWLGELDRELNFAASNGRHAVKESSYPSTLASISPIMQTEWGQSTPYWNECPVTVNGDTTLTCCVSTAMSQIMYVHKWPKQGKGSIKYTTSDSQFTLSRDFSQRTYDWENMINGNYSTTSYTKVQADAVARIMSDFGYATRTDYGTKVSVANEYYVIEALYKYFDYDPSMRLCLRNGYKLAEWIEMLYGELAAGRPVFYGGYTKDAEIGHAFVIDGYRDGYFHVNWGYEGYNNGYYLISVLDYRYDVMYECNQNMVIGIHPRQENTYAIPELYYSGDFNIAESSTTTSGTINITNEIGVFSADSAVITPGLKLTDSAGNITYITDDKAEKTTVANMDSSEGYNMQGLSKFPTADSIKTYTVSPAFLLNADNTWHDIRYDYGKGINDPDTLLTATVEGTNITFARKVVAKDSATIKVVKIDKPEHIYPYDTENAVRVTVAATGGDYSGYIFLCYKDENEEYNTMGYGVEVNLTEGYPITVQYFTDGKAGTYRCWFEDNNENRISEEFDLVIEKRPETDFGLVVSEPANISASTENFSFDVTITATKADFNKSVYARIYSATDSSFMESIYKRVKLTKDVPKTFTFRKTPKELEAGKTYYMTLSYVNENYGNTDMGCSFQFTVTASGVTDIDTSDEPQLQQIFNTAGILVDEQYAVKPDLSKLPRGIYIVKTPTSVSRMAR